LWSLFPDYLDAADAGGQSLGTGLRRAGVRRLRSSDARGERRRSFRGLLQSRVRRGGLAEGGRKLPGAGQELSAPTPKRPTTRGADGTGRAELHPEHLTGLSGARGTALAGGGGRCRTVGGRSRRRALVPAARRFLGAGE